ncbi:MAG: O-antigen ligase family protein [Alphaproteobacteria bacterium]
MTPALIGAHAARASFVENAIFWLFVAGLAWVPFWHGSNEAIAWGINAMLFPGLAVVYEAGLILRSQPHPVGLRSVRLPAALFLLLVSWIAVQSAAGLFPDAANPVWAMAGEAVGAKLAGSISVNRDLTAAALLRLITGAGVFWLALQLCRDTGRARTLVAAIAVIGGIYAAYGLIAAKTSWLRMPNVSPGDVVSATFINPNAYAAFAGIGFIATAGVFLNLCRRYGIGAPGTTRTPLAALVEMIGCDGAPVLAGGFIILTALLLTGSRGGIAATGLAVVAFAVLAGGRAAGREARAWPVPILGLVLLGGTGLLFGAALGDKIAGAGFSDANRLAVYRVALQSILDRPWLGWGYGTFVDVFPMYRDFSVAGSGTWSQAHNTYLEAVQGLGIVFGSIFVALIALPALRCFRGAVSRRGGAMVPLVAVAAVILVGAHALVDFSLQIQAVALTVAALLGAGTAQAERSSVSLADGSAHVIRNAGGRTAPIYTGRRPWLTALLVSALCGYAVLRGYDLASAAEAREIDEKRSAPASEPTTGPAGETGRGWIGIPGLGRSAFDLPLAQIAAIDPETGGRRTAELSALVAARPLSSQAWLSLAIFRLVARETLASVVAALQLSWATGPNEGSVLWQRGVFGLALWAFLPSDARERTMRDLARAIRERLVADPQAAAVRPIFAAKSAETRAQMRVLLERHGLRSDDLGRIGLRAE